MLSKLKLVVLAAGLLLSATLAQAADEKGNEGPPPDREDCGLLPCIFDSHNQKIGLAPGMLVFRHGEWFRVEVQSSGFLVGADFYYADAACAGTPLLRTGYVDPTTGVVEDLPHYAPFDGTQLWGPVGPAQAITIHGFRYNTITGPCETLTSSQIAARPAVVIDTTTYVPPFSIR